MRYFRISKNVFIIFLLCFWLIILPTRVFGDAVTDENYTIDVNTIDTNPQPTPRSQVLGIHNKKTIEFTTGSNYTVNTVEDPISIGISQNLIDFGILSSTNPVIRTSTIMLATPLTGGQILSFEDHPLMTVTRDSIQNTTCDNGACSADTAALWNNTLTYGFGYRCDSNRQYVCDSQFTSANYYKQFPTDDLNELPEVIIANKSGKEKSSASVTYKVTISGTQKTGGYYNNITYLAIPNF